MDPEETPAADQGYRQPRKNGCLTNPFPKHSGPQTYNTSKLLPADKMRVDFIRGSAAGSSMVLRIDIALDRIKHGWARKSQYQGEIVK